MTEDEATLKEVSVGNGENQKQLVKILKIGKQSEELGISHFAQITSF